MVRQSLRDGYPRAGCKAVRTWHHAVAPTLGEVEECRGGLALLKLSARKTSTGEVVLIDAVNLPCLDLPAPGFKEPRLLTFCPYCFRSLKFNPFFVGLCLHEGLEREMQP